MSPLEKLNTPAGKAPPPEPKPVVLPPPVQPTPPTEATPYDRQVAGDTTPMPPGERPPQVDITAPVSINAEAVPTGGSAGFTAGQSGAQILDRVVKPVVEFATSQQKEQRAEVTRSVNDASTDMYSPYTGIPTTQELIAEHGNVLQYQQRLLNEQMAEQRYRYGGESANQRMMNDAIAMLAITGNAGDGSPTNRVESFLKDHFYEMNGRQYISAFDGKSGPGSFNLPIAVLQALGSVQNVAVGGVIDVRNLAQNTINANVPLWARSYIDQGLKWAADKPLVNVLSAPLRFIADNNKLNDGKSNTWEAVMGAQYSFSDKRGSGVGINTDQGFRVGAAPGKGFGFDLNPAVVLGVAGDILLGSVADDALAKIGKKGAARAASRLPDGISMSLQRGTAAVERRALSSGGSSVGSVSSAQVESVVQRRFASEGASAQRRLSDTQKRVALGSGRRGPLLPEGTPQGQARLGDGGRASTPLLDSPTRPGRLLGDGGRSATPLLDNPTRSSRLLGDGGRASTPLLDNPTRSSKLLGDGGRADTQLLDNPTRSSRLLGDGKRHVALLTDGKPRTLPELVAASPHVEVKANGNVARATTGTQHEVKLLTAGKPRKTPTVQEYVMHEIATNEALRQSSKATVELVDDLIDKVRGGSLTVREVGAATKQLLDDLPAIVADTPQGQAVADLANIKVRGTALGRIRQAAAESLDTAKASLDSTDDIGRKFSLELRPRERAPLRVRDASEFPRMVKAPGKVLHGTRVVDHVLSNADPIEGAARSELGLGHYVTKDPLIADDAARAISSTNLPPLEGRTIGGPQLITADATGTYLKAKEKSAAITALAQDVADAFPELRGFLGRGTKHSLVDVLDRASKVLPEADAREFQKHMTLALREQGFAGATAGKIHAVYDPASIAQELTTALDDIGGESTARASLELAAAEDTGSAFSAAAAADSAVTDAATKLHEVDQLVQAHQSDVLAHEELSRQSSLVDDALPADEDNFEALLSGERPLEPTDPHNLHEPVFPQVREGTPPTAEEYVIAKKLEKLYSAPRPNERLIRQLEDKLGDFTRRSPCT